MFKFTSTTSGDRLYFHTGKDIEMLEMITEISVASRKLNNRINRYGKRFIIGIMIEYY